MRIVSYFSSGVPSAVATKLALTAKWPSGYDEFVIYNFEIVEEHEDNKRFLSDCQKWFGHTHQIETVGNDRYNRSTDKVFLDTKYLVGPYGARCTSELKKAMRHKFGKPSDLVILGYTSEEEHRVKRLQLAEPMLKIWPILIEKQLDRNETMALFERTTIELPIMYRLGYRNNNCIGCVKGGAGYWNKIRKDFPNRFAEMAKIERQLGRTICKREWVESGERKTERIYLDELPEGLGRYNFEPEFQCGIFCHTAEMDISAAHNAYPEVTS